MSGGWPIPRAAARKCHLPAGPPVLLRQRGVREGDVRGAGTGPDHPLRPADLRPGRRAAGGRLALGGRPGARLTGRLACAVSRSTLLRLIRAAPDPDSGTPLVLGVDDFALRKGHVYGTVLVDIETRRPVDVLAERSAESFRAWLDAHPGAEIICRDRGGCYAEGAAEGAPLAIQVADRWHLWHNLAEAVERAVARHRPCLQEPPPQPEPGPPLEQAAPPPETGLAARTRARHAEVHAALARGLTITEISRALRLERKTVRRYATAATPDQLICGPRLTRPGPARPAPGLPAPALGRRNPQHRTTAPGTARTRLPGQPAHPAPAHLPAPPRHRRPRPTTRAGGQESGQLDPHPAGQASR